MNKRNIPILAAIYAVLFAGNYASYQIPPLADAICSMYGLNAMQLSSLVSAPMIPAIFLSLAAGMLADRFGVKLIVSVAMSASAFALIIRIFVQSYTGLFISMIAAGLGVACFYANLSKTIGLWFDKRKAGAISGVAISANTLGMTVATATASLMSSITAAFTVSAAVSCIASALWILFMKRDRPAVSTSSAGGADRGASFAASLTASAKCPLIWVGGAGLFLIYGANMIVSTFLPSALSSISGYSAVAAGTTASLYTLGMFGGSFAGPIIYSRFKNRKAVIVAVGAASCCVIPIFWLCSIPLIEAVLAVLSGFLLGFCVPVFISFPMFIPSLGSEHSGTAGGILATLQLLGCVIIPTYIASPISGGSFHVLFIIAGICMLIMSVTMLLFFPKNMGATAKPAEPHD